jgi:hypothetical protein
VLPILLTCVVTDSTAPLTVYIVYC